MVSQCPASLRSCQTPPSCSLIWPVVPRSTSPQPSASLAGEGAVLPFHSVLQSGLSGDGDAILLAASLPPGSAAASHLGGRVAADGCPLPCLPGLGVSFAIKEDRIISPWNPINYQVQKEHLQYRKIIVCAQAILDYAFMFK